MIDSDEKSIRRRILAQGRHILQTLIEAHSSGTLQDPHTAVSLCSLFSLCADGKVKAHFDEVDAMTKWSLTEGGIEELRQAEQAIVESKIIKGPWKNSIDTELNT
jgi:hypothetical protein